MALACRGGMLVQAGGRLRTFLLTQEESHARQRKAQTPGQLPMAPLLQQTGGALQWWSTFCNRPLQRQGQFQLPGHSLAGSTVQHRHLQLLSPSQPPEHSLAGWDRQHRRHQQARPAQLPRHYLGGSAWKHRHYQQQDLALLLMTAQASPCRHSRFPLLPELRPRRSRLPSSRLQRAPAVLLCLLRSRGLRGGCRLSSWLQLGLAAMLSWLKSGASPR